MFKKKTCSLVSIEAAVAAAQTPGHIMVRLIRQPSGSVSVWTSRVADTSSECQVFCRAGKIVVIATTEEEFIN